MDTLRVRTSEDWSREFWGELVCASRSIFRRENVVEVFGWTVRLVWDDGTRGTIYLCHACDGPATRHERLRYVYREFDPRREARLLLAQIRSSRTAAK